MIELKAVIFVLSLLAVVGLLIWGGWVLFGSLKTKMLVVQNCQPERAIELWQKCVTGTKRKILIQASEVFLAACLDRLEVEGNNPSISTRMTSPPDRFSYFVSDGKHAGFALEQNGSCYVVIVRHSFHWARVLTRLFKKAT